MIALEVAEGGVSAEDGDDEGLKLGFAVVELVLGLVWRLQVSFVDIALLVKGRP